MQSNAILLVVLAVFLIAATRGGIFHLFIANTAFALLLPQRWEIAGISLDCSDLMFFAIAAGCFISPHFAAPLRGLKVPYMRLWVLLGCILTVSYMTTGQSFTSNPIRAGYQVYRYCWKPILYYPLAAALIQATPRRSWLFTAALVLVGGLASALHLSGLEISELFFTHKNRFGGALVAPAVLGLGLLLAQERLLSRKWIVLTFSIIWATLVLLGSRGAFVGAAFGAALVVLGLLRHTVGRARTARLAGGAVFAGLAIVAMFPQLLSSQGVATLAEMQQGAEVHNLQWRMTERWPHYIAMIAAHPWVGTGQLYDESAFEQGAKGAHNGYLSIALQRGVPASLFFFGIPMLTALRARRTFRSRTLSGQTRILVLASGAAIVGIMMHNLVDSTVLGGFTGQAFWTIAGIAGAAGIAERRNVAADAQRSRTQVSRPRLRPVRLLQRPLAKQHAGV